MEANRERPFYLQLWHHGVHGPWGHKEEYTKQFAGKKDPRAVQGNPLMASMLKSIDESFGRLIATLERLKLTDHTIVIFYSDNGGNVHSNLPGDKRAKAAKGGGKLVAERLADWRKWAGELPPTNNDPLRDGKGTLYEGGVRVPLMWSWPGVVKPGTTSGEIVAAIDLYPTILDAVGVARPPQQKIDGVSYAGVLKSGGNLNRAAYFTYFPHPTQRQEPGVTVRAGDWKLIRWMSIPARHELYNLREDLGESRNLAAAQPGKVKELDSLIASFLEDTGAVLPQPNPAYRGSAAGEDANGERGAKKKKKAEKE